MNGAARAAARLSLAFALGALAASAALAPGSLARAQPPADAAEWRALLEERAVLVEPIERADGLLGLRLRLCVRAPRERAWGALIDYENFPRIFPRIERVAVLESSAAGASVEFWVDTPLRDVHYVLRRNYEQPGRRLTWTRLSGDLSRIEGSWDLLETTSPDQLLLVYESFVQAGGLVPGAPLRWLALRSARGMAERLRQWMENPGQSNS